MGINVYQQTMEIGYTTPRLPRTIAGNQKPPREGDMKWRAKIRCQMYGRTLVKMKEVDLLVVEAMPGAGREGDSNAPTQDLNLTKMVSFRSGPVDAVLLSREQLLYHDRDSRALRPRYVSCGLIVSGGVMNKCLKCIWKKTMCR